MALSVPKRVLRWFLAPDCNIATFNIGLLFPGFDLDVQILAGFPLDLAPHRVVPVRFARAATGPADPGAPDIDDHGYTICTGGPAEGPSVGVSPRALIRVKLIRDRIGDDAPLFVTVDDASVAAIDFPVAGTPLSATDVPADPAQPASDSNRLRPADCVILRGGTSTGASRSATLSVHFGSAGGPVIAKLAVFQHPVLVVPVQMHKVTINGLAPRVSDAKALEIVSEANRILAQASIRLQPLTNIIPESVTGFGLAGTVNTANNEEVILFNTNPQPNVLNVYYFRNFFDNTLGMANAPRFNASAKTGFLFATEFHNGGAMDVPFAGHIMAHELGHVLGLEHYGNGQQEPTDTVRQDTWSHRSLMHNRAVIEPDIPRSSPARVHIGYGIRANGSIRAGSMVSHKKRTGIPLSGEIPTMRSGVVQRLFLP